MRAWGNSTGLLCLEHKSLLGNHKSISSRSPPACERNEAAAELMPQRCMRLWQEKHSPNCSERKEGSTVSKPFIQSGLTREDGGRGRSTCGCLDKVGVRRAGNLPGCGGRVRAECGFVS